MGLLVVCVRLCEIMCEVRVCVCGRFVLCSVSVIGVMWLCRLCVLMVKQSVMVLSVVIGYGDILCVMMMSYFVSSINGKMVIVYVMRLMMCDYVIVVGMWFILCLIVVVMFLNLISGCQCGILLNSWLSSMFVSVVSVMSVYLRLNMLFDDMFMLQCWVLVFLLLLECWLLVDVCCWLVW